MSFDDLAVLFVTMQIIRVERNWWPTVLHVVVEPLLRGWLEERVSKEIFPVAVGGGAPIKVGGGRAVPRKCKVYDCTKGYPGEDVTARFLS